MDKVLLVIPAFNEEKNIERVVEDLVRGFPYLDYVVVNDGSRDSTAKICRDKGYNLLDLPVNLGLAGCFQAGMKYAYRKGDRYAIQFDGDGQHRPEYIEAMRQKMEEGYDIVIGSRFVTEKKGWSARMIGSRVIGSARFRSRFSQFLRCSSQPPRLPSQSLGPAPFSEQPYPGPLSGCIPLSAKPGKGPDKCPKHSFSLPFYLCKIVLFSCVIPPLSTNGIDKNPENAAYVILWVLL